MAKAKAIADEKARLALAHPLDTRLPAMSHPHPVDSMDNGGWTRVRHDPLGPRWGPCTDSLSGTCVTGNAQDDSSSWAVKFDDLTFTEMLFASGDMQWWMVMTRDQAIGSYYANAPRNIKTSSLHPNGNSAKMYRR